MERPRFEARLVVPLAAIAIAVHLATNLFTPYGIHRDELLYLAMGRHLDLFRMEFPPAIAIIAETSRGLFGDSLVAIRFFPAVAAAALVVMSALVARELGGGRFAQALGALAVLMSPLFLRAGNLFQPVVFDQLWWTLGLYALARLARTKDPKWWLLFGAAVGFGLLTKFSTIFFGLAVLLAVIATDQRRWLLTPWPWIAVVIALALGSPGIIGQIRLDFPVMQQMQDLQESQLERVTPAAFVLGQVLLGPAFLVALAGLISLIGSHAMKPFRVVGFTCLFAFLILLVLKGKPYYLGPVYPALFGAGGVAIERIAGDRFRGITQWSSAALITAFGFLLLPIGVPILPPETMAGYAAAIGATPALRTNSGELDRLPQDYADMLGWPEQVAAVAEVFNALSPADRERAVVLADNYGEAGAIDFFGPRHGLPRAISAAGTYWFFGPGERPGDIAVAVGIPKEQLRRFFRDVKLARVSTHAWSVSEERNVPIHVVARPFKSIQEVWPSLAGRN